MNKLNKIFYGPAGTGKTRSAIEEAVKIVGKSNKINFNIKDEIYSNIIEKFKSFAKLPDLQINNSKLVQEIQKLTISVDSIVSKNTNEGDLKYLTSGVFNKEKAKEEILKYRAYPFIETVTFHPSYSYQDFVEGITVETNEDNKNIEYKVKDGIFKKICDRAIANSDYKYVLIIDEINRGDISSIFGELFTLLEDSKRQGKDESMSINLPYSKDKNGNPKKLTVPSNLHIVATMNTVDKSIALIDVALRRRFDFEECMPRYDLDEFKKCKELDLSKLLQAINERITILKNEHYQIGHSYFLNIDSLEKLEKIMRKNIIPLLQEYFYDDWESICAVLNQSYKSQSKNHLFDISDIENSKTIFSDEFKSLIEHYNKKIFTLKENFSIEAIKSIYE